MTLSEFIKTNNIKAADSIAIKNKPPEMLDGFLIYLGFHYGQHKFMANFINETRILNQAELSSIIKGFFADKIRKFKGNEVQRNAAVNRALNQVNEDSYHLLLNNCEHKTNYRKTNSKNKEAAVAGTSLIVAGLTTAAASKNSSIRGIGLFAAAVGLITLLLDEE